MTKNIPNKKIVFDNFKQNAVGVFGFNIPMGATVQCDITALTMSDYKCILNISNVEPNIIKELKMVPNEVLSNDLQGKYIKVIISTYTTDNKLIKLFVGQEILGAPQQTLTNNSIKLTLMPTFYLEQKTMNLKVLTKSSTNTEYHVKKQIADYYNLSLKSYSSNDKKQITTNIDELIKDPIKWLKARYVNENIYATDKNLFCVENGKTLQSFMDSSIKRLDEQTGLKYINQINANLYEVQCFFLPEINLFDTIMISPLTKINKNIVNGRLKGKVMQLKQSFNFSNTSANSGETTFNLLI